MNKNIAFLKDITKMDSPLYGGKGSSLGELVQLGIIVPNAFVVSTKVAAATLLDHEKDILAAFDSLSCDFVAVRSSATCEDSLEDSFAGQFDTYLNVHRAGLMEAIFECYNSLQSERVVSYAQSKNIDIGSVRVAVVVQQMVQSEVSGIAFSVNPVTKHADEVMIEAGFGLGEYVVSGIITPDKYLFDKKSGAINEIKINYQEFKLVQGEKANIQTEVTLEKRNAQKLPSKYHTELIKNLVDIERHYQKPVDIEWAIENEVLFITQARPITTLTV